MSQSDVSGQRVEQIVQLAAQGLSDKQIAARLGVTTNTIITYWKRIRRDLGMSSRTEIVAEWIRQDILQRPMVLLFGPELREERGSYQELLALKLASTVAAYCRARAARDLKSARCSLRELHDLVLGRQGQPPPSHVLRSWPQLDRVLATILEQLVPCRRLSDGERVSPLVPDQSTSLYFSDSSARAGR